MSSADYGDETSNAVAAVSEARQWNRLMEMARIGAIPADGVNRACLTDLDRQARRLLISWGKASGSPSQWTRSATYFCGAKAPRANWLRCSAGSHMDSQPNGGRFDGIWGVIAALEAVQALHEAGVVIRARPIEIVGLDK